LEPAVLIAARVLLALSVVSTLLVIDAIHVHLVRWGGFEALGAGVLWSYLIGSFSAVAALVIVAIAARSRWRPQFKPVLWLSSLCLLVLIGLNVEPFVRDWLG
jgi:amino acid permease